MTFIALNRASKQPFNLSPSGNCFRFNSDGAEYSETAGVMGGLTVELDTRLDEYYIGPFSKSPGFAVILQTRVPDPTICYGFAR